MIELNAGTFLSIRLKHESDHSQASLRSSLSAKHSPRLGSQRWSSHWGVGKVDSGPALTHVQVKTFPSGFLMASCEGCSSWEHCFGCGGGFMPGLFQTAAALSCWLSALGRTLQLEVSEEGVYEGLDKASSKEQCLILAEPVKESQGNGDIPAPFECVVCFPLSCWIPSVQCTYLFTVCLWLHHTLPPGL